MSSEKVMCGFCGLECKPEQDTGFLVFPDGKSKAAHLTHPGVKDEYDKQMGLVKSE